MSRKPKVLSEPNYCCHVFRDERFIDLGLYQFGWERCDPLHQFGPAIRNHFLFHYVLSGRGMLEASFQKIIVEPGQGFLICPKLQSTYYADPNDPWTYAWVEFDGLRARECMTLAGLNEKQMIYTSAVPAAKNKVEQYIMDIVDSADAAPIRLVGMAMVLLDEIVQTSKTKISTGNKRLRDFYMREATDFISRNFQRDLSIEEIANVCGLNRSYFGRLFKDTYGESPQKFLINYRMAKAAELLKGTEASIAEISKSVGYENQLNFSRAFKNIFGISPSEYRGKHYLNDN